VVREYRLRDGQQVQKMLCPELRPPRSWPKEEVERAIAAGPRAASHSRRAPGAIDVIMACSVALALLAFVVWFIFLSGSPLPPAG